MNPRTTSIVILLAASMSVAGVLAGCATMRSTSIDSPVDVHAGAIASMGADEALQRLTEGNARFVADKDHETMRDAARRSDLANGQHPFAVVLSCSDSRVPPELVFDQEFGDIFVVRVAGNTADDVALGSIEYAVEHLGAKLIVVMGHEQCGAVATAVEVVEKGITLPGHLPAVVADITPVVKQGTVDGGDIVHNCVWHNTANVAAKLRSTGPLLPLAIERGQLRVCAAVYDLESGVVRFLPQPASESPKSVRPSATGGMVRGESLKDESDSSAAPPQH